MINKEIINKINEIFLHFQNIDAKLWNMDTDVFNMWQRFAENLKYYFSNKDFIYNTCEIVQVPHPKDKNNFYYKLLINKIDVTPISRNKDKGWSYSGMRQFLQTASAFGYIMYSGDDNFKKESTLFHIPANIVFLFNDNFNWKELFIKVILHSLNSNISFLKNFGLSLFFTYIWKVDKSIFSLFSKTINFKVIMQKKNKKHFNSCDLFCNYYAETMYKESYKNLVNLIIDDISLGEMIDYIHKTIKDNIDDIGFELFILDNRKNNDLYQIKPLDQIESYKKKFNTYVQKLNTERGKLRTRLISTRTIGEKRYCDLELNDEPFLDHTEAAHIYEVSSIKNELCKFLKNNPLTCHSVLQSLVEQASDANNGLLLPNTIHKEFDRGTFNFDINGKIIYQKENLEKMKALNIENSRIKQRVLNDEMIEFLKKRII